MMKRSDNNKNDEKIAANLQTDKTTIKAEDYMEHIYRLSYIRNADFRNLADDA